jgi:hypothetical protein
MPTPSDPPADPTGSTGTPRSNPPLVLELERELECAVEEIEAGHFVELSPEDLDRWAETGAVPWPRGFPD